MTIYSDIAVNLLEIRKLSFQIYVKCGTETQNATYAQKSIRNVRCIVELQWTFGHRKYHCLKSKTEFSEDIVLFITGHTTNHKKIKNHTHFCNYLGFSFF
jgi:hypothetical protein